MISPVPIKKLSKKYSQNWLYIVFILISGLWSSLYFPVSAQPESSISISQLPAPPRTPPPNRTRSGGSLGEVSSCQDGNSESLAALVPETNPVFTTSAHPTFFFYVPLSASEVEFGEFSVLVGLNETAQLYRTQFALPQTPGIVYISLPNSLQYGLEEGTFYHWYLKLYCKGNTTVTANLEVNAWVQRITSTEDTDRQINAATPDIWYDSLAQLADRLQASPQDSELRDRWYRLLEVIHLTDLAQEPIVGSVQILEND